MRPFHTFAMSFSSHPPLDLTDTAHPAGIEPETRGLYQSEPLTERPSHETLVDDLWAALLDGCYTLKNLPYLLKKKEILSIVRGPPPKGPPRGASGDRIVDTKNKIISAARPRDKP